MRLSNKPPPPVTESSRTAALSARRGRLDNTNGSSSRSLGLLTNLFTPLSFCLFARSGQKCVVKPPKKTRGLPKPVSPGLVVLSTDRLEFTSFWSSIPPAIPNPARLCRSFVPLPSNLLYPPESSSRCFLERGARNGLYHQQPKLQKIFRFLFSDIVRSTLQSVWRQSIHSLQINFLVYRHSFSFLAIHNCVGWAASSWRGTFVVCALFILKLATLLVSRLGYNFFSLR